MIIIAPASLVPEAVASHAPGRALAFRDAGADLTGITETHQLDLSMDVTCCDRADTILTEMIGFAKTHDWQSPLLVTCKLGISRSPASAFIIACAMLPEWNETEIAKALRVAAPCADPHLMMIAAADDMLDRDGRMMDALDEMGSPRGNCIGQVGVLDMPVLRERLASS